MNDQTESNTSQTLSQNCDSSQDTEFEHKVQDLINNTFLINQFQQYNLSQVIPDTLFAIHDFLVFVSRNNRS